MMPEITAPLAIRQFLAYGHPWSHGAAEAYWTKFLLPRLEIGSRQHFEGKFPDLVKHVIRDCIAQYPNTPVVLPLSGGIDSRLILWGLQETRIAPLHCFTIGHPRSSEVRRVRKLAKSLSLSWVNVRQETVDYEFNRAVSYANKLFQRTQAFTAVQSLLPRLHGAESTDLGTGLVFTGWSGRPRGSGVTAQDVESDARGNVEDAIARLARHPLITEQELQELVAATARRIKPWIATVRQLGLKISEAEVVALCYRAGARGRAKVGDVFELVGMTSVMPFFHPSWLAFWYRLPIAERKGSSLLKSLLLAPEFESVFHSDGSFMKAKARIRSIARPTEEQWLRGDEENFMRFNAQADDWMRHEANNQIQEITSGISRTARSNMAVHLAAESISFN